MAKFQVVFNTQASYTFEFDTDDTDGEIDENATEYDVWNWLEAGYGDRLLDRANDSNWLDTVDAEITGITPIEEENNDDIN